MNRQHHYSVETIWTGNKGEGTANYSGYERSHTISAEGKCVIEGSSDPAFRGDKTKYNPEELLVASLSSCHMLWFLHLCAEAGVVVVEYNDTAKGTMIETPGGKGHFAEVTLYPVVTVKDERMIELAESLHRRANESCFIANSCNFPVYHKATCLVK